MARQRSRRSSGGGSGGGKSASPGLARAMRGLRGFAYQAAAGMEKVQEAASALIPVIKRMSDAFAAQRQSLADLLPVMSQATAGFRRLTGVMMATSAAVQLLTAQYAGLGSVMLQVGSASLRAVGSLTAVRTAATAAMAATSSGMAAASASTWSFATAAAAAAVPFALLAAAVGVAYVAAFKWQEVPGWLKLVMLAVSPIVQVIRALALAWNVATAPFKLLAATVKAPFQAVSLSINGITAALKGMASKAASLLSSIAAGAMSFGKTFARGMMAAGASLVGFAKAGLSSVGRLGSFLGTIGGELSGLAGKIVNPLTEAGKQFAAAGEETRKLAETAGVSAVVIGELGYAAERSGMSVSDLASMIGGLTEDIDLAAGGSKQFADKFEGLNLSFEEMNRLDPESRFLAIGMAVASIADPFDRTRAASAAFGSKASDMLKLFDKGTEGIAEYRKEAQRLGIVMSTSDVSSAKAFTEALKSVQDALTGLWQTIGAAVAPQLTEAAQQMSFLVKATTNWARRNSDLIATVFKVTSGIAAFATGLTTAAAALTVMSPALLATGVALAAGWKAWGLYGMSASKAVQTVMGFLSKLWGEVSKVIGGVKDAIAGGDLELAVQVAFAGVNVAWVEGMRSLAALSDGAFGGIMASIASGDWSGAIEQVWTQIQVVMLDVVSVVDKAWTGLMNTMDGVIEYLKNAVKTAIGEMMAVLSKADGIVAAIAEYDFTGKLKQGRDAIAAAFAGGPIKPSDMMGGAAGAMVDPEAAARKADRTTAMEDREKARTEQRDNLKLKGQVDADKAQKDAAQKSVDVGDKLQAALDKAAAARDAAAMRPVADLEKRGQLAAAAAPAKAGGGFGATFSGAALVAMGGGGTAQEQTAKATQATAKDMKKLVTLEEQRQKMQAAMQIMVTA